MKSSRWGVVVPPEGAARSVMQSVCRAFEICGIPFTELDSRKYSENIERFLNPESRDLVNDIVSQSWVCRAVEEGWTHVLVGALSPVTNWTLMLWKKLGITTVFWMYEDYRQVSYWKEQKSLYDLFCAIQKEPFLSELGRSYRCLPNAASSLSEEPVISWSDRLYDLAFIGIPTSYRAEFLLKTAHSGVKLVIAGTGWEQVPELAPYIFSSGWADDTVSALLYRNSRLVLNISQKSPWESGDLPACQISPRVYDSAAHGSLPITENLPLGQELFSELNCITFDSVDDCIEKIRLVLNQTISSGQYEYNRTVIREHHLYTHRVRQIMQWCEQKSAELQSDA